MPKYHMDVQQNSEAWDNLHIGIATASAFDKIITPTGKSSTQYKGLAYKLIAERIMKRRVDSPRNMWMERGHELEDEAVAFYEFQVDMSAKLCGFVETDDGRYGCSPDRLVGEDGLLEIKCPAPNTQVEYLIEENVAREYYPQIQGQLFVTGRKWVDIIAYYPVMPPSIIRVERDDVFLLALESLLKKFSNFMDDGIIKIADRVKGLKIPERKPDAIEQLLA